MKKKILILLALILIPISAKADSMDISCTSYSLTVGGTTKCSVKATAHKIGGGEGKIAVSNGTVQSFTVGSCIQLGAGAVTNSEFTCINEEDPNGVTFVTYVIKATQAGTMTFKVNDAKFVAINSSGQYDTVNAGTISKNIAVSNPTQATTKPTQATQRPTQGTTAPAGTQPTQGTTQAQNPREEPTTGTPTEEPTTEATEPVTGETTTLAPSPRTDSNTKLASLTIKGVKFDFNSDKTEYNIEITSDITNLEFSYKPYKENATVKISSDKLVEGMNKIEVVVIYEGESTTYKLNINKKAKADTKATIIKVAKIVGSVAGMIGLAYLLIVVIKK